jgi:hypothetical protein
MRRALHRTSGRTQHGQAVVEFALVLPVLFLLVVGVIFFARAFQLQQVLSGAAHEGARVWAKNPPGGALLQCGNLPCQSPDPPLESTNFYLFVMPAVKNYIRNSGFSDAEVIFFTTQKSDETSRIKQLVRELDADNDRVTITIYYRYSLPLGNLGQFSQIYLKAGCTMKRG